MLLILVVLMIVILLATSQSNNQQPPILRVAPPQLKTQQISQKSVKFKDIKSVRSYSTSTGDIISDRIETV